MRSKFLNLNTRDFLKGLLIAVLTAVLATVGVLIESGTLFTKASLTTIGIAALSAFLAYISKNLFTNTQGEILTPEL